MDRQAEVRSVVNMRNQHYCMKPIYFSLVAVVAIVLFFGGGYRVGKRKAQSRFFSVETSLGLLIANDSNYYMLLDTNVLDKSNGIQNGCQDVYWAVRGVTFGQGFQSYVNGQEQTGRLMKFQRRVSGVQAEGIGFFSGPSDEISKIAVSLRLHQVESEAKDSRYIVTIDIVNREVEWHKY